VWRRWVPFAVQSFLMGSLVTSVALGLAVAAACGRKSSPTAPSSTSGASGATVTITAAGVSPREVRIRAGSRVTFVNNDTRSHNIASDPHPEHTDCREINQVGFLQPGQSRETGNFVTPRTCGYHDHDLPTVDSLRGRIVVEP
jgi:plastocyanin